MSVTRSRPDRLAVVTGTSSGIGAAAARQLLDLGWRVVGCSRRSVDLAHPHYQHECLDLGQLDGLKAWADRVLAPLLAAEAWARVGLVNNAASADLFGIAAFVDPTSLLRVFTINAVAPTYLMAFVGRCAPRATPLRIVNVSTGAAAHPLPGLTAYGSSKAALRHAGATIAAEWSSTVPHATPRLDFGITSYEPGVVDTAMQEQARHAAIETMPWRGRFEDYARRGVLVPPDVPAAEIVGFLEGEPAAPFVEARLTSGNRSVR